MDAITSALSSLNSSGALKGATEVAGLGSTAYNLYNQYENQQYQDLLRSYAQDPSKMNAYAAKFTQPLNAGLTTGVANQAQAYLASRGLSDSPQISEQVEAQAIAPYIQQNQQQGYQDALQALNLGGGAVNPNSQSANTISALAKMFAGGGTGTGGGGGLPTLANYLRTMGTLPAQIDQSQWNPGAAPGGTIDTSGWGGGGSGTAADGVPDFSGLFASSAPTLDQSVYMPDYSADLGG